MKKEINQWFELHNFEKKISQSLEDALKKGTHSVSLNEFYVLHFLDETNGNKLRISDLSEKIGLSLSATSRMLGKFENTCKVIERISCENDKREIQIKLTEEGKTLLEELYLLIKPVLDTYRNKLSLF